MDSRLICTCGLSESEMTGRLFACSISAMYTHTGLPPKLSDNWRALINYMHAYMYTYIYIYTYRVTPNALGHECPHKLHTFLQMCTNILYLLSDTVDERNIAPLAAAMAHKCRPSMGQACENLQKC